MSQSPPAPLGVNAGFVDALRERFEINPKLVDPAWAEYFAEEASRTRVPAVPEAATAVLERAPTAPELAPETPEPAPAVPEPATAMPERAPAMPGLASAVPKQAPEVANLTPAEPVAASQRGLPPEKAAKAAQLILSYRARGHRIARVDPLDRRPTYFSELDPASYGLTDEDLDVALPVGFLEVALLGVNIGAGSSGVRDESGMGKESGLGPSADYLPLQGPQTLRSILETLQATYCRSIGVEFMHIQDPKPKQWLVARMEPTRNSTALTGEERLWILERLTAAEGFESFLHRRFIGQKRFSLEGGESLIPLLDGLVEDAPLYGIREYVLGMAHRGRLNVLCNFIGKSMESIFVEFEDLPDPESPYGSGDVKYHKGFSSDRQTRRGPVVHLSLTSNPSHLEAVDPVVLGRARAKQQRAGDPHGAHHVPVLMHGDAAFAGQGIVAETLNLSQLEGYFVGGTVHVVIDNQIGFTTTPAEARSTLYPTDVAKMIQVPIFHVNGDDPEAVVHVARLALAYRQEFQSDVVINLVCYRRHGHNEGDEPRFTQPLLYAQIETHTPVRHLYQERLLALGILSQERVQEIERTMQAQLEAALASIKTQRPPTSDRSEAHGPWAGYSWTEPRDEVTTALPLEQLTDLAARASRLPPDFQLHPKLAAILGKRTQAAAEHRRVDWAFGETLAYASLLAAGYHVRLSGQDSARGTFSHRHAVLVDQQTGREYAPLAHLGVPQGRFEIHDSLLSEAGVLGFEYGYSVADPETLTIWEAQFGDFANGAQVIIDQFVASAQAKWRRMSGLVFYLPHGYEGQGPEHSSARIERFLQLCAEDNLQIVVCTTPAQIFHLLRRQMLRKYRAPLVVFTPKSLLRLPAATSPVEELAAGRFHRVLEDPAGPDPGAVRRVLFCTGKVYYDLHAHREQTSDAETAIVRVEQIYPFPRSEIRAVLDKYPHSIDFRWVQEEPRNAGAWGFVKDLLASLLRPRRRGGSTGDGAPGSGLTYVGRPAAASPAVGSAWVHTQQQQALVATAFRRRKHEHGAPGPEAKTTPGSLTRDAVE